MYQKDFSISTPGQGLIEITNQIEEIVAQSPTEKGLCNVFVKHTSASLLIQENARPAVLADLNNFFKNLVPESENYLHSIEGPDDMPAHIKNALTLSSLLIPDKSIDFLSSWSTFILIWDSSLSLSIFSLGISSGLGSSSVDEDINKVSSSSVEELVSSLSLFTDNLFASSSVISILPW